MSHGPWRRRKHERVHHWRLLLRQVPAITDLQLLDASGRNSCGFPGWIWIVSASGIDFSQEPEISGSRMSEALSRTCLFPARIRTLYDDCNQDA